MKPTSTPHSPRWTLRLLALLALLLPPAAHAQFTYVTNGGTLTITRYTGNASTVAVPSRINGRRVTRIGTKAFYSKYYLTRVSLPPTLTPLPLPPPPRVSPPQLFFPTVPARSLHNRR